MKNTEHLEHLKKLSKDLSTKIKLELNIFEQTVDELIKNVPDDDKPLIEKYKGLSQRTISLAKQGKLKEAQELIKTFKHGSKNNK